MYETIRQLYLAGKLTDKGLANALERGWITREQADALTAPAEQMDTGAAEDPSDG